MEDGYTTVLKGVSLFFVHESADVVLGWAMPNQLRDATVSSFTFLLPTNRNNEAMDGDRPIKNRGKT